MKDIRGAIAVITGAGSGIGQALAQQLAARGAHLALADMNQAGLEETRALAGSAQTKTYVLDVADPAAMQDFARQVEKDFGRASLLINNAGVALYGTFAEVSLADIDWLMRINFWGVVHGCKFFLPLLQREPEAHIVNISSVFGLIAPPGHTAYSASKFAVRGFTQALRQELAGTRIQVSCVHPAGIKTKIAENARAGVATNAEGQALAREHFSRVLRIAPERAAEVIMRGILRNKGRILIGADAYRVDFFARLMPVRCASMLASFMERRAAKVARK